MIQWLSNHGIMPLEDFVTYTKSAMLLTFGDSPEKQEIQGFCSEEEIRLFFWSSNARRSLFIIVDQLTP